MAIRRNWFRVAGAYIASLASVVLLFVAPTLGAHAQDATDLASRITAEVLQAIFPGAERFGATEGKPPAAPVYIGEDLTGFVLSTLDVVAAVGYTPPPFDVLAGVTVDGELTGVRVHAHHETIFGRGVHHGAGAGCRAVECLSRYYRHLHAAERQARRTERLSAQGCRHKGF